MEFIFNLTLFFLYRCLMKCIRFQVFKFIICKYILTLISTLLKKMEILGLSFKKNFIICELKNVKLCFIYY